MKTTLAIVSLLACSLFLATGAASTRPNILFILADDLGWSDLGCYGNERHETPNLDRLADEGIRFTQACAPAPICSASRASFLTGRTPARLGFEFVTKDKPGGQTLDTPLKTPPFTLNLPLKEFTMAEALVDAGYRTGFFGKWHLNQHHERYLGWSPTHGPKAQGFQVADDNRGSHPYSYWNSKKNRSFLEVPDGEFPEDGLTENAIEFLQSDHGKSPFFLMVSHYFVHTPVHTRVRWLYDRYLEKIPDDHPRRTDLAHYGAMVTTLDHHVGQLLAALHESIHRDNTLVVFTSDNGGHPNYAGNAPLRGSKWNLYEGGIRVPMMARWPGEIDAGSVCEMPVTGFDLFPTFVDLAEAKIGPENTIDGFSLRSAFQNPVAKDSPKLRDLIWHFPYYYPERGYAEAPAEIGVDDGFTSQTRPHSVLRSGDWKLIHFYEENHDELYHLPSDLGESKDRSQSDPKIAEDLRRRLDQYLERAGARLPKPQ